VNPISLHGAVHICEIETCTDMATHFLTLDMNTTMGLRLCEPHFYQRMGWEDDRL